MTPSLILFILLSSGAFANQPGAAFSNGTITDPGTNGVSRVAHFPPAIAYCQTRGQPNCVAAPTPFQPPSAGAVMPAPQQPAQNQSPPNNNKQQPPMPPMPSGAGGPPNARGGPNSPTGSKTPQSAPPRSAPDDKSGKDKTGPDKSKKPVNAAESGKPDGLCTKDNDSQEQVKSGNCQKLSDVARDPSSCAYKKMTEIINNAAGIRDVKSYCPDFATYGSESDKREVLRQLLAAAIQRDSKWKADGGLFRLQPGDFGGSHADCPAGSSANSKQVAVNLKCGSCKIMSAVASAKSFGAAGRGSDIAASIKRYCKGRPGSSSSPGTGSGR
jgi:hypothetical protein